MVRGGRQAPRHFAWQAWHLATSTSLLRGRPGRSVRIVVIAERPALLSTVSLGRPNLTQCGRSTFTHNFVTRNSFTHNFLTHNFLTHNSSTHTHTQPTLSHTTFQTYRISTMSFVFSSFSVLLQHLFLMEEVDWWGYPVL